MEHKVSVDDLLGPLTTVPLNTHTHTHTHTHTTHTHTHTHTHTRTHTYTHTQLYEMAHGKMQELQTMNISWIEAQFMTRAVDVLCQCRQTLMYSYCFAFYLKKNNHTLIFEVRALILALARQ